MRRREVRTRLWGARSPVVAIAVLGALGALGALGSLASPLAGGTASAAAAAPAAATAPAAPQVEATGEARTRAEALFSRYIDLEHAFDPAQAELFSDNARIEHRIIVPGQRRPVVRRWSGVQYKQILRNALQKAKAKKEDLSYYSATSYLREGERVRVKTLRYSKPEKSVSPVALLVGPDAGGTWRILEEVSEAHPLAAAQPPPKQ
jgi:hypothetical protein